jgi:hypothetical protein
MRTAKEHAEHQFPPCWQSECTSYTNLQNSIIFWGVQFESLIFWQSQTRFFIYLILKESSTFKASMDLCSTRITILYNTPCGIWDFYSSDYE